MARPSKYEPEFVEQARKLAKLGLTDVEIASFFSITERTLYRWRLEHEDFAQALAEGKTLPDQRVKESLYKSACGYDYVSEKVFQYEGKVVRAQTVEHVKPNVIAQIFYLKNRLPAEFRNQPEPGADEIPLVDPNPDV